MTFIPNVTYTEFRLVSMKQGALTLPDTWFRPSFWDLLMLQLLRPVFPNLPCLFSTFHLEYPSVLSRFCSSHICQIKRIYHYTPEENNRIYHYTPEGKRESIRVSMICNPRQGLPNVANHGHEDGTPLSLPQCSDLLFFSNAFIFNK